MESKQDPREIQDLLRLAKQASKLAGEIIMPLFEESISFTLKKDQTPVTIADQKAEEAISEFLQRETPNYSILGEELGEVARSNSHKWIIDPIDGTQSFVQNIPLFGTLISLEIDEYPVLGIIAFVGWNKIGTSVKDKELVVECDFSEGKEEYTVVSISNGKMCFMQPDLPTLCAEIEIFDSEVVKTKSLNRNTSAMAQQFLEETSEQREFYWKLNRKTGILGIYWSNNDQYIGPGSFVNCRKKEKL